MMLNILDLASFAASLAALYFGFNLLNVIYNTWLGQLLGKYVDLRRMGKWAVITGATDGIGKAYAEELARLGINVVLISRSLEKLQKVAEEIEQTHKVKTKVITADFTDGLHIYETIRKDLKDLQIGILINNVGMVNPPAHFLDMQYPPPSDNTDKLCLDMINCNIISVTMMTRIILPQMVERRKGVVINLGSIMAIAPTPWISMYGASKAFMDKLSRDLDTEYKDKGIIVQSLLPAYIVSNMSQIQEPSLFAPSAKDFVTVALKTVGLQTRTAAYPPHRAMLFVLRWAELLMPNWMFQVTYRYIHLTWLEGKRNVNAKSA